MAFDMVKFANTLLAQPVEKIALLTARDLPGRCASCAHFDGDAFCALPTGVRAVVTGSITQPRRMTCELYLSAELDR